MPKMSGSQILARTINGYGIDHVFFMPVFGVGAMRAMEDMPICRVMAHSEKSAAYMADGYARAARKPGVVMAQAVGAANLAAGLKDAGLASSPVVAITGGADPEARYRNAYQETEDLSMFDAVTKFNAYLDSMARLPAILRQLFRTAVSGSPGPVHLRVPQRTGDVLGQEVDVEEILFEPEFASYPPFRPAAELAKVAAALDLLASAERPVIVAGGGVTLSGAAQELVQLAERLNVPVATSLNAKECIADSHELAIGLVGHYSRECANRLVGEADLVFFVGSRTGSLTTNFWKIPRPGTTAIQLDIDPIEIGRNYPAKVGLMGDVKVVLGQMLEAAKGAPDRGSWLARCRSAVEEWRASQQPLRSSEAVPIRPERICQEVERALPNDGVLVSDTGHSGMWTGQQMALKPGQRFIRCAGSLGWGLPGSIGVKCGLPNRPVICFSGDGGMLYHLSELETALRFGIRIVVVVNNNQSLNQDERSIEVAYQGKQTEGARKMWTFEPINYAMHAQAMGCVGLRVEHPSELGDALRQALASDRPAVVDVVSDIAVKAPLAWG